MVFSGLLSFCYPYGKTSSVHGYVYNRDRIEKLDPLWHGIVHGDGLTSPLVTCGQDIEYMQNTSNFLMALVNHKYDIKIIPSVYKEYLKGKSLK